MTDAQKRVVRTDLWMNPAFEERLAQEPGIAVTRLAMAGAVEDGLAALSTAHVYQVSAAKDELPRQWFVTRELLAHCPQLLLVSSGGAGYDTIDVKACTEAGVAVANQAGANALSVAEHTMAMLLSISRRMSECDRRMRSERGFPREEVMGHEVAGKTIGLVGIGNIGTRVAAMAPVFGLTVIATDPFVAPEEIARRGAQPVALDELLARADIVSLHCPRTELTLNMMDARRFGQMKEGAIFINTARGGIHDEAALTAALQSGHLYGAGLDVWDVEPPPLDHPLLQVPNVFATFHNAGVTHEARRNLATWAASQIIGTLRGERPPRLLNPEVWPRVQARLQELLAVAR